MKKFVMCFLALAGVAILSGCMSAPGGIAPSTVPITSKDSYTILKRDASGSDYAVYILGFPMGPTASAYKALQHAKKNWNADALINVTAENKYATIMFPIIYTERIVITGDAIKFRKYGEDM